MSQIQIIDTQGNVARNVGFRYSSNKTNRNVVISNNVKRMMFSGVDGIGGCKNIKFGTNILSIDRLSMSGCTALNTVSFNNVEYIGPSAFYGCTSLVGADIGQNTTKTIGDHSFCGCTKLKTLSIKMNQGSQIGNYAFKDNTSLESVTITGGCQIGNGSFEGCSKLSQIQATDVRSIGQNSFCGCTGLSRFSVGRSLSSIGDYAFGRCSSLAQLQIQSSNLKYIGEGCLSGCSVLRKITIPACVDSITCFNKNCFAGTNGISVELAGVTSAEIGQTHGSSDDRIATAFSNLGATENVTYITKDKFVFQGTSEGTNGVSQPGVVPVYGSGQGLVYFVGIAITKPGYKNFNFLKGMEINATKYDELIRAQCQKSGRAYESKVLLGKDATVSNIENALDEAIQKKPNLLIFMFADHGGRGYMCCYDGEWTYGRLFEILSRATDNGTRLFLTFLCCYPNSGNDTLQSRMSLKTEPDYDDFDNIGQYFEWWIDNKKDNVDAGNPRLMRTAIKDNTNAQVLIWQSSKNDQKSIMDGTDTKGENSPCTNMPGTGTGYHWMLLPFVKTYDGANSYQQQWEKMSTQKYFTYKVYSDKDSGGLAGPSLLYIVTPEKHNIHGNFDESKPIFQ